MNIKKNLCTAIAVLTLATAGLASCSDKNDNSSTSEDNATSSSTQAQAEVTKNTTEIADKLKSDITYKDTLNELSTEMITKLLDISPEQYTNGKVYVGSGGATAEEIACFEATDADNAAKIKTALEERVESQKKTFENYQPQEMDKLNSPVIIAQGNYVFMCISDDNAKAEEIIG